MAKELLNIPEDTLEVYDGEGITQEARDYVKNKTKYVISPNDELEIAEGDGYVVVDDIPKKRTWTIRERNDRLIFELKKKARKKQKNGVSPLRNLNEIQTAYKEKIEEYLANTRYSAKKKREILRTKMAAFNKRLDKCHSDNIDDVLGCEADALIESVEKLNEKK